MTEFMLSKHTVVKYVIPRYRHAVLFSFGEAGVIWHGVIDNLPIIL